MRSPRLTPWPWPLSGPLRGLAVVSLSAPLTNPSRRPSAKSGVAALLSRSKTETCGGVGTRVVVALEALVAKEAGNRVPERMVRRKKAEPAAGRAEVFIADDVGRKERYETGRRTE